METDKENVPCGKGRRTKRLEIKKEPVSACDETVNLLKAFNSYLAQEKGAVSQEMPGATLREVRRELGRRWSGLQNMMMGIQDKWDRSGDSVMARLQEKLAWAATKRAQLEAVVVGQSLTQVKRQAEEHRELRCAELC